MDRPGGSTPAEDGRAALPPHEVEARLALFSLPGVGILTLEALLRAFGSGVGALEAPEPAFDRVASPGAARLRKSPGPNRRARQVLDRCRELGATVLVPGDPRYPSRLGQLHYTPPFLYCLGDVRLLLRRAVTVVGSRRATSYGRRVAQKLGEELARKGVAVVSGLALGVDGAAHRGALRGSGETVAVLGAGPDRPHPRSHAGLFRTIGRQGLLVSEFPPGTKPEAHHFPRRNRILAALGAGVVVVEAGRRSGARITVEHANDLGREVFAVPGPVDRPQSEETNRLIGSGAHLVTCAADILDPLGWATAGWSPAPGRVEGEAADGRPAEGDGARPPGDGGAVWDALAGGPLHLDDLCREVPLPPGRLFAALTTLEVGGRIRARPGRRYERVTAGAGT